MVNHKRIVKNTLFLYFRMLLTMGVSLYTVRVVLNVLGVEDFGIYHVVGGLVALFSFLSHAMSSASQRFFSHALGQKDDLRLKQVFTVNGAIYCAIAVLALVLLETLGLWFVHNHLAIPQDRTAAVLVIFQLTIVGFVLNILASPFQAMVIAHEDMHLYAYLSVLDAVLRLGAAFMLPYLSGDKIIAYGILMLAISVINSGAYFAISKKRYPECQFKDLEWNKTLAKEIIGFTGWTLFGSLTTVGRNQAITILLNQYFSPIVVAARVIAVSLGTKANMLSQNFNVGMYPPIIKSYAANDKTEMFTLLYNGSKISFFLMWIVALPLFVEMDAFLTLWLTEPPKYAVVFTQLALVESMIMTASLPLGTAARAPGKMALYEGTLGSLQVALFLVAWMFLGLGFPPDAVFYVAIGINLVMFIVRLALLKRMISLSVSHYLKKVLYPITLIVTISGFSAYHIHSAISASSLTAIFSAFLIFLTALVAITLLGFNKNEKDKVKNIIALKFKKLVLRNN